MIMLSHYPQINHACILSLAYQEKWCHPHCLSLLDMGREDTLLKCDNLFSEK